MTLGTRMRPTVRSAYMELIATFPLTAIENDEELEAAIEFARNLAAKKLSRGQEIYLETLSRLIEAYEDDHYPIEAPEDAAILRELMDSKGVRASDIARGTRLSKSTISLILSGERPFSKTAIAELATFFEIDQAVLSVNIGKTKR